MHDNPALYPHLPSRELDPDQARLMIDPCRGTEWQTCWEYVLTHRLTESEGSAFWHGANLGMTAALDPDPHTPAAVVAAGDERGLGDE